MSSAISKSNQKGKVRTSQAFSTHPNKRPIQDNLFPLIKDEAQLKSTYAKRRDSYVYLSIHPADQQKYEDDGWEVHKGGNKKVRIKRLKSHNVLLEDQVWCLFYRMGYPHLGGNNFTIRFKRVVPSLFYRWDKNLHFLFPFLHVSFPIF